MANYDIDNIMSSLTLLDVVEYLDIPHAKRGSTIFLQCPNPNHIEKKYDNCAISKKGNSCTCYSCGEHFGRFQIVKKWHEKSYGQNLNGQEVYGILGDIAGGRERFLLSEKGKYHQKNKFPFSNQQLDLLGLEKNNRPIRVVLNCEKYSYYDKKDNMLYEDEYEISEEQVPISVMELWNNDKEAFWYLINSRAKNMIFRNHELYEQFKENILLASAFREREYQLKEMLVDIAKFAS